MKTILHALGLIILIYILQSCTFNAIKGDGNITEHVIPISDYNTIHFRGSADLIYEQKTDTTPYLRIETDENLFPLLVIKSDSGILSITNKENTRPTKYNIYTNSTSLQGLAAGGSIKAHIKGKLASDDLKFKVSGSGDIVIDSVECKSILSRVSGSGSITLTGKTGKIDCAISGSGKVGATNLIADTAFCSVSGSGDFYIYANKYLKVDVSGSGDVRYKGDARVEQSISGSGKVVQVD